MVSSQAVPTEGLEPAPHYVPGHPDRIKLDEGSPKLKIRKKVQPDYPQVVRDQRIEGKVALHAIIGKNGSLLSVDALSGDQELIEAARYAVKKWKYEPMVVEGKPVEVDIEIYVFSTFEDEIGRRSFTESTD